MARVYSLFLTFVSTKIIITNSGSTIYAQLMVIFAIGTIFAISDLGISNSIVNLIAGEDSNNQKKHIVESFYFLFFIWIMLSAIILSPLGAFIEYIFPEKSQLQSADGTYIAIKCGIISVVSFNFYLILVRILQALKRNALISILIFVCSTLNLLFTVIASRSENQLILLSFSNFGIHGIIALTFLLILSMKFDFSSIKKSSLIEKSIFYIRKGKLFVVIQFSYLITFQIDTLLISHFLSLKEVAQFSIYFKIYTVPVILLSSILNNLWSETAILRKKGLMIDLKRNLLQGLNITYLVIFTTAILGFFFCEKAIYALGSGYVEHSPSLNYIFIVASSVTCITVPLTQFLYGFDAQKFIYASAILGGILNVAVAVCLLRVTHFSGSTLIATLISQVTTLVLPFYIFRKKFFSSEDKL